MKTGQNSVVAVVSCSSYAPELLLPAVRAGIGLLGGASAFAAPEEHILLKPNLLNYDPPERAVCTHPAVIEAAARCLLETGCVLSMGDSPGGVGRTAALAARSGGLTGIAARLPAEIADFSRGIETPCPQGRYAQSFPLCPGVLDAGGIINLPKMKTHALERITGAVKNLFGCVYGTHKAASHAKWPDAQSFAGMLCDLSLLLRPRLHILDGILAMEGNGPASGDPVAMNLLLFSADPVALDSVFCALIDLDPALVPTCVLGEQMGLGVMDPGRITLLSPAGELSFAELSARYGHPDFRVDRSVPEGGAHWAGPLLRMIGHGIGGDSALHARLHGPGPEILPEKCTGCGYCVRCCPLSPPALRQARPGQAPRISYRRCVRCYCCQESCPQGAVAVRPGREKKRRS